jgi:cytochrome c-type biogenesis protein CcmF
MPDHANLPLAPAWSLVVGSIGRGLIFGALALFVASVALWALAKRRESLAPWGARSFTFGALALFGAFGCLVSLFVTDQFHFQYVHDHNDKATDFAHKIAGVWAGQEGSFLLWSLAASVFGLAAVRHTGAYRRWFTISYATFLGSLAGIMSYETPFRVMLLDGKAVMPPDGVGMMPALHNAWITIHPPTIFLGFGALTVLFCWAFAALATRDLDSWIRQVRPWAIIATTILGLGLCMGGFWAYETLGWGGFWAWDPVENVSFVPWCISVAFFHGAFVQVARRKWHYGNALLAAMGLLSFIYGTFLTRSGFLGDTSVHSFAEMDRSALRLLVALMAGAFLSFGALWLARLLQARRMAAADPVEEAAQREFGGISKTGAYASTIWFMSFFAVAAGFGMSVPLVMGLMGRDQKVVEEFLYHQTLAWVFIPTMIAMAIAPFLSWRSMGIKALWGRISTVLALSLGFAGLALIWAKSPFGVGASPEATVDFPLGFAAQLMPWMGVLIWVCLFVVVANLWRIGELWKRARPTLGGMLMHIGVATTLLGLIVSRGFERSERFAVQEGRPASALGYTVTYLGNNGDFRNRDNAVKFQLQGHGEKFSMSPVLYYRDGAQGELEPMSWPDIYRHPFYDVYFTLGAMQFEATDPLTFKVGEEKLIGDEILIRYEKMVRQGEPGVAGTRFGAHLTIASADGKRHSTPWLSIGDNGPEFEPAPVNRDLVVFLQKMDAADQSVTLQLHWLKPQYPVELFYKPMTILVWVGTGIMTLGGLIAALYRRRESRQNRAPGARDQAEEAARDDAPVPVP